MSSSKVDKMRVLHIASWPAQFVLNDIKYMNRRTTNHNFFYKVGLLYYYGNNTIYALLVFFINVILSIYHSWRINRLNIDIIHCHFIPPILTAFFTKKPTLVFINESANSYPSLWIRFFKFFLRYSTLIYISNYNKEYWSKYLGKGGIVVYYAVDTEIFNVNLNGTKVRENLKQELKSDYLLISMGVLDRNRGFEDIIAALSRINQKSSFEVGLILKVYGRDDSYEKLLRNLISQKKVSVKILSHFLYPEELARLFKSSDIFIRSNKEEGFGIAPLEAMACGIPLILSEMGCHLEIFGQAGEFYKFNDIDNLILKIEKLLMDTKFREIQVQKGLETSKNYNWDSKIKKILKLYSKILKN